MTDVQTALANEARRSELRQKKAGLQGGADAIAALMQRSSSLLNDLQLQLSDTTSELESFEQGAGPGVTADFGPKSAVTQIVETERAAAKAAVVDYVQANPACSEDDAAGAWNAAATAATGLTVVLQDAKSMSFLYRSRLAAAGLIAESTWEAHRDWICATPKATILTM